MYTQLYPEVQQAQRCHWAREGVVPSALHCVASTPALHVGWLPQYEKGIKLLESVQRRSAKTVESLKDHVRSQYLLRAELM